MFKGYENILIRPPRTVARKEQLGPVASALCFREDIKLRNRRGQEISCSFWRQNECVRPCVVFCHGNASNRGQAVEARDFLLSNNFFLFSFDFAGCGESEGEFISLGFHERDDVECVVQYLSSTDFVSSVALWGRSMGSSAIMLWATQNAQNFRKVKCLVFDGIFKSITSLSLDVARSSGGIFGTAMKVFGGIGMSILRKRILEKAHFNIDDVVPLHAAEKVSLPGIFFHARQDSLFPEEHVRAVFNAYASADKTFELISGDHNDFRGAEFWDAVLHFLFSHLSLEKAKPKVLLKSLLNDSTFVVEVVPFCVVPGQEELQPMYDVMVPGPLILRVMRAHLEAESPFTGAQVLRVEFEKFLAMDAAPSMFRIMLAETSGLIIQCTEAETLMHCVDNHMNALLRDELERNLPAVLDRVRRAAQVMLKQVPDVDKISQNIEKVMLNDVGAVLSEEQKTDLSKQIRIVVAEESELYEKWKKVHGAGRGDESPKRNDKDGERREGEASE